MKKYAFILVLLLALMACKREPAEKKTFDRQFITGYEERYGQAYDSVPLRVFALDLYSQGLILNEAQHMEGTGTNLYISDIFLPDTLLVDGDYRCSAEPESHTFLPGKRFDDMPTGIYLLRIEEGDLKQVEVLDSGHIAIRTTDDGLRHIDFHLYQGKDVWDATFEGELHPLQKHAYGH